MSGFSLRPALEADAPTIQALIELVDINPAGLDWRRFVLAVDGADRLIGCGQLKPHGKEVLELASIAVHPEHRGKGIARAVIEHLLAASPRPLFLMCQSSMGKLYEKFGFQTIDYEHMPRYFQRLTRVEGLVQLMESEGESLLIMKLE